MSAIVSELHQRWRAMFAALERGDDVPPSTGLRAEGLMEAAVLTGQATPRELDAMLQACCREQRSAGLEQQLGADWRSFYPFPQIPLIMQRAPVYPSTRD